jgi:hypothetical protein
MSVFYDYTTNTRSNYLDNHNLLLEKQALNCSKQFKRFTVNPLEDCPTDSIIKYGCIDDLGKDLIYHKDIIPPVKLTWAANLVRETTQRRMKLIGQEACVRDVITRYG